MMVALGEESSHGPLGLEGQGWHLSSQGFEDFALGCRVRPCGGRGKDDLFDKCPRRVGFHPRRSVVFRETWAQAHGTSRVVDTSSLK